MNPDEQRDEKIYDEVLEEDFELWFEQARDSIATEFIQELDFNRVLNRFGDEFKEWAKTKWRG